MLKKIICSSVLALGPLSVTAPAQTPLLALSTPQRTARGGFQVTLTNHYSAAVTAFVLDANPLGAWLPGSHPYARHVADLIPGLSRNDAPLAPGQSRTVALGMGTWGGISYRNSAVIYADDASAGDPALTVAILNARKAEALDIAQVLPILARAQSDPRLAQDLPALIQTFVSRAQASAVGERGGPLLLSDRICDSAAATLRQQQRYTSLETPQRALAVLVAMFTAWQTKLSGSVPTTGGIP